MNSFPWILLMGLLALPTTTLAQNALAEPRFPAANLQEAWKLLPRQEPALPSWALTLVNALPRTTGALLELDYLQRDKNPLGAALTAKVRYVAAQTMGSDYGLKTALGDLRRAGISDKGLKTLSGDFDQLAHFERATMRFARNMTQAAHTVTDQEVAELEKLHGPAHLVALVHTLAYANFHNRLVMALGSEVEAHGPLPARDFRLDAKERLKISTPNRPPWEELLEAELPESSTKSPSWRPLSFDNLQQALAAQKKRQPRLKLLEEDRLKHLPPPVKNQAMKIFWSNLSMGYQPQLTGAWFNCMSTFQQEAKLPKVFTGSMFWVVTRSNECFY